MKAEYSTTKCSSTVNIVGLCNSILYVSRIHIFLGRSSATSLYSSVLMIPSSVFLMWPLFFSWDLPISVYFWRTGLFFISVIFYVFSSLSEEFVFFERIPVVRLYRSLDRVVSWEKYTQQKIILASSRPYPNHSTVWPFWQPATQVMDATWHDTWHCSTLS